MNISEKVLKLCEELIARREDMESNWDNPELAYSHVRRLTNDETGDIGELLAARIFEENGFAVAYEQAVTAGDKDWDIVIDGIKIEIKTATIGRKAKTFQHEKVERERNYDAILIFDFTATDLYACIAWKEDIKFEELSRDNNKLDISLSQYKREEILKFRKYQMSQLKEERDLVAMFNRFRNTREEN